MSDHQTYAYFYVTGFNCSPDEVSVVLGFEPTGTWVKGEKWGPKNIRERKKSTWIYKTNKSDNDPYSNVHFKELLEKLERIKDRLERLPEGCDIGITYVPTCYYPNIAVILDNELLLKIAGLGLSIDFDIYSLNNDE